MNRNRIVAISVLTIIFTVTAVLAFSGMIRGFENSLHGFINPNENIGWFFKFFTDIGEAAGVICITAFFMLLPVTRRRVGAPLSMTVTSSWLITTLIKRTVRRQRPLLRLIEIGGYSFPSGHAMNNAALYVGIMLLLLKLCKNRIQKAVVIIVCLFMVFVIGVSRIYFNVHYFSDVVCGWCLGSIVAIVFSGIEIRFIKDKVIK